MSQSKSILENVVAFAKKYSDDAKLQVGACVVLDENHTYGTNRFYYLPEGTTVESMNLDRLQLNKHITHAEVDAITLAPETKGAVIYTSYTPCDQCALKIAAAGIKKVVSVKMTEPEVIAKWAKFWAIGQSILRENNIEFVEE